MSRLRCMLQGMDLKTFILLLFVIVPIGIVGIYFHGQKVTYFLRPLWQSPPKPFINIPHYYHPNVSMENLCKLHGWGIREYPRRVFDAVLFNNEVDMLTIRWKELKGENPFVEEAYQRVALDHLLRIAGIQDDDLLIMSDVDEIPSRHTIDLLRWCDDIPPVLHLQLKNYLYSFEFLWDHRSWRASIHRYQMGKTRYAHFRRTDYLLSDAGWHCSFCFRQISEFVFKMKAYSHYDRVRFSHYLNPKRIQDIICKGADLYDMIPEEYTF
ncbi:beta-1,4-N-acetylglucosaminyltransferase family protein [Actinidia rufa]|uniref:Beta-1,4-N-acetylglucosaminyltransferase family protein n=1 Tax=Actinidia rufa TaxID=165716 RepID=A0A7J0H7H8_9ERIC|nr:beta-1,4-N-acetylglucosaminyltransferase family protein [Actinidia rufa]